MTREMIYECAGPGCISSVQSTYRPPVPSWIEVRHGSDRGTIYDFCSWNCVVKFAGDLPLPLGSADRG